MADSLAGVAAQAVLAADTALVDAALNLGVAADVLQAQITVGDLISATVLPPQNGVDLLQILGQQVVAQVPPGVHPGDTLLLQVTAFSGNQILVRNLGVVDPENPPATVTIQLPPEQPATGTLTTLLSPNGTSAPPSAPSAATSNAQSLPPASGAPSSAPPQGAPPPVSPPREVFVAASVRPSPVAEQPAAQPAAPPNAAANLGALEARIAAARAADPQGAPAPVPPATPVPRTATPQTAAPPSQTANAANTAAPRLTPRPDAASIARATVEQRAPSSAAPVRSPQLAARTVAAQSAAQSAAARSAAPQAAAPADAQTRSAQQVLRSLGVPATQVTLAAARVVRDAVAKLPAVLQRLEAALPRTSTDARITSLRTLIGFATRLDPANARVLPEQISAYVSNVVEGAETKLASIVRAFAGADAASPSTPPSAGAPGTPTQNATAPAQSTAQPAPADGSQTPPAAPQVVAHAQAAERGVALEHDLKGLVLSLVRNPPADSTALAPALGDALTALTAVQLNALAANTNAPNSLSLTLPVFYHSGGSPTQIRISRDARGAKPSLDADNFHIAFVLDTASLGTVAIDLQTVGRAVNVSVRTERQSFADRFATSLTDLRTRLETLRYRIASIGASVAARPLPSQPATPPPAPVEKPNSRLDLQA